MLTMKQDGNVISITLSGKVTAEDVTSFYNEFTPAIETAKQVGIVIDVTGFDDMTEDAIRRDIPLEMGLLDQMGKIPKVAVITDKEFIRAAVTAANPLVPMIDMRVFAPDQKSEAISFSADLPPKKPKGNGAHLIDTAIPGVLAFEVDGYIDDDEIGAITAAVEARIARGDSFNALARIKSFRGFDPAILTDGSFFKMKLGAGKSLVKYAIVSDESWMTPMIGFARTVTGIDIRHFPLADEQTAWGWVNA
ncbi:MAG: STAS/SEC14 domain-containing protein [Cypionkella sp.]